MKRLGFFDSKLSPEQLRTGVMLGGLSLFVAPIALVTLLFPHKQSIRWSLVLIGVLVLVGNSTILAIKFLVFSKERKIVFEPVGAFILVNSAAIAIGLMSAGYSAPLNSFAPAFAVVIVLSGVIGNITFRLLTWITTTVSYALSLLVYPNLQWGPYASNIIFMSCSMLVIQTMIGRVMQNLAGRNSARILTNELAEIGSDAETFEEAFAKSLAMVDRIIPTKYAIAYSRLDFDSPYRPVANWPGDISPEKIEEITTLNEDKLVSGEIVIKSDLVIIPVGFTEVGQVVILISRAHAKGYAARYPEEASYTLSGGFLKMTSQLSYLRKLKRETLTDPLTGLSNRRAWGHRMDTEISRSRRSGTPLSI
ncbi:MAG: hypothetical protein HKL80_03960, partial [Acidimicrobiales bacterium]|nr:hypothetical protein [Acidimicrobiales bacterium]